MKQHTVLGVIQCYSRQAGMADNGSGGKVYTSIDDTLNDAPLIVHDPQIDFPVRNVPTVIWNFERQDGDAMSWGAVNLCSQFTARGFADVCIAPVPQRHDHTDAVVFNALVKFVEGQFPHAKLFNLVLVAYGPSPDRDQGWLFKNSDRTLAVATRGDFVLGLSASLGNMSCTVFPCIAHTERGTIPRIKTNNVVWLPVSYTKHLLGAEISKAVVDLIVADEPVVSQQPECPVRCTPQCCIM